MEMDLVGIKNQNEYYTNHYFTSIFQENAEEKIKQWKAREKEEEIQLPWKKLRDISRSYYRIRDRYQHSKNENHSKDYVQELADLYLNALGYENRKSVSTEVADGITVPVFHEETKVNGSPLLWAFLCVAEERGDDILQGRIFEKSDDEDRTGKSVDLNNDDILTKLFFAGEEAPRFIILVGINQIALIDRNKWNEKRYLQFMMDDIFSRHEESTFMAITVLLHKESLCPSDGGCVLDYLDENSHKHSAGVSDALKYALRECIEILGNEVIYDMKTRQGINLSENPVDASELTLECLRYMYRFLFMLFIEARPELGYAPMKSQTYVQGYSLEGLRDVCDRVKETSEVVAEGYYIYDTISELFRMIYEGYPRELDAYKKAREQESLHDVFTIEALKAHIFDPEYTKLITRARLRNCAMLQIVDLMSISRPTNSKERRGRISYSALGINQMGAVYEALLSYRGFIAEETLFEVKRKGEKFNELDVGYFIPERELDNYEEDERVRYEKGDKIGQLRKYEQGTFIYRLAGREREKSASYYTPEVLTKCLVKYALKELLKEKTADDILNLTICEPAMGSAAFLNEAINQLAEAYLNKKQEELGEQIAFDKRFEELQKVKMFIADRNVYGVDLNPIAVELAEVSLWLNTIYKGAYVPWFGTQLVCGNSLIGARRQVYYTSRLERGKWYEEAPDRIMPGEKRKRTGVSGRVYHFLLGDPGMANYTDKVIKSLEPYNIKKINDWRKKFTAKFDDEDIKTVLRLSDTIDTLWDKAVELRKRVKEKTTDKLSVYGYEDSIEGSHLTIREKDELLHSVYMSEGGENASPYARLKAAMDYWCALWFWPIDKAELLPSRQEFFFEMSLILEGGIAAVTTSSSGQMSLLDSTGNISVDEEGKVKLSVVGSQLELDFKAQYADLGVVNLDDLRQRSERLAIVYQIAKEQRFQHWELEFADVFANNGGFDLIIGNPPWIKISWSETHYLGDCNPIFVLRKENTLIKQQKIEYLQKERIKIGVIKEFVNTTGQMLFLNAVQNYYDLKGQQTNLYKCFLPLSWMIGVKEGISAFVHPDGVFNDPAGGVLREGINKRLVHRYQFANEFKLFTDIKDYIVYCLNVYSNKGNFNFDMISNLYYPTTIDDCYLDDEHGLVPGIKDSNNKWNIRGHVGRVIKVNKSILSLFSNLYDSNNKWEQARIPALHATELLEVLRIFANQKTTLKDQKDVYTTQMFDETGAQNMNIIKYGPHFTSDLTNFIYSGPLIGVANPLLKSSRKKCILNCDYDVIDLEYIDNDFIQRCKYQINDNHLFYMEQVPELKNGKKYTNYYRLLSRKMINLSGERSLMSAIVPPKTGHTNGLYGIAFEKYMDLVLCAGFFASIPYDFFIKSMGTSNLLDNNAGKLPFIHTKYDNAIMTRALALNALTSNYAELVNACKGNCFDNWAKYNDCRLKHKYIGFVDSYTYEEVLRTDYERREVLVELDVLVAMALGMSLEQLISIYTLQFPVLKQNEEDTWYDINGKIIFTSNKGLFGVGIDRKEWENIQSKKEWQYEVNVHDEAISDNDNRRIVYQAPFTRCNRENDYAEIWQYFEERYSNTKTKGNC